MIDQRRNVETMKISDVRSQLNKLVNRGYRKETWVVVGTSDIPVEGSFRYATSSALRSLMKRIERRGKSLRRCERLFVTCLARR